MQLVYSFRIDKSDAVYKDLAKMSRISKDLYNQALFEIKEHYKNTKQILFYKDLDKIMKQKHNLDEKINYRLLPAQVSQQTLKLLSKNVKAFFKALADYKEHPEKYNAPPQFPNFLPRDGHFIITFTNQKAVITDGATIKLWKKIEIAIPVAEFTKYRDRWIKLKGKRVVPLFAQIRIIPKFNGRFFNVEIVYENAATNSDVDKNKVASLDLGVNNLITMIDSAMGEEDRSPQIINGKPLKSINQYYNKIRAQIQQELIAEDRHCSHRMNKLTDVRNQKIHDYMHKASRFVIRYCLANHIGRIVIGYNPGWKQEVNMRKANNQNFVGIPFLTLISMISYKASLVGIDSEVQRESYTSKCSALDLESIGKHEDHAYAGKRIKRGLFRTATGICLNADVNGALNILRKVIGDSFLKPFIKKVAWLIPSRGYLRYPLKVCYTC